MKSITNIDIWNEPAYRISNLIDELRYVRSTLEETSCENIVERICNDAYDYAVVANMSAPSSDVEKSRVEKSIEGTKGEVALVGSQAVYDEFGTGEEGKWNPHPLKENFGLNPYNSGPHIFYNQLANRYQWFYTPMAGKPYFTDSGLTSGIPSGKQMYNTLNHIRSIKDEIIAEEINEAIQTLK